MFAEHGILTATLPPNMTGELQPMDLAVNGPLKAAVRKARVESLTTPIFKWREGVDAERQKPVEQRNFDPPP